MFYSLLYPYIMAHNYSVYSRFLNIMGIDQHSSEHELGNREIQAAENGERD